jgi:hypothetical protein
MHATVISDQAECDRIWALADRVFAPYATYRREAAKAFFGRLPRQRPKTGGYRRPERKLDEPETGYRGAVRIGKWGRGVGAPELIEPNPDDLARALG